MRNAPSIITCFTLAAAFASGCEVEPTNPFDPETRLEQQATARISGLVTVAGSGDALPDALVTLSGVGDPVEVSTGDDGGFVFSDLMPSAYTLEVTHPAHLRAVRSVDLVPGSEVSFPIALDALDALTDEVGQLTGTAQRFGELALSAAEQDHGGVLVEVEDTGIRTVTGTDGRFDVFLQPGTYSVVLSDPDHITARVEDIVVVAAELTEAPGSPIVLQPDPGTVSGTALLDDETEHGDVLVSVIALSGTSFAGNTASDGSFSVGGLAAGVYTVRASKDGFVSAERTGVVVEGGRTTAGVSLALAVARGRVTGRVQLSGATDHSGATVGLTGTTWTAGTNADGDFVLEGVEIGTYELTARKDGFVTGVAPSVVVTEGATVSVGTLQLATREGDFDINGGAIYTNDPVVTLEVVGGDAVEMRVSEDSTFVDGALGDTAFVAFASPASFTLSDPDGTKTVYVQLKDAAGLESAVFASTITLDRAAPHSTSVVINGGASFSNNVDGIATLALTALDDVSGLDQMVISNDGTFDTEVPEPFTISKVHALADPGIDGLRTVTVRFIDRAGNVSADPQASDEITLDRAQPMLTSFTLACGSVSAATHCKDTRVLLEVDTSDATEIVVSNTLGFPTFDRFAWQAARPWDITPGDGTKTVYLKLVDAAGNESAAFSAMIELDTVPPSGTVSIDSGAAKTGSDIVTVSGTASEDVIYAASAETVDCNTATFTTSYATAVDEASFVLLREHGTRAVAVCLEDRAGNRTVVSDTIEVDVIPPGGTIIYNEGLVVTNEPEHDVKFNGWSEDTADYYFSEQVNPDCDAVPDVDYLPFADEVTVTLSGTNGVRQLWMCVRDDVGNTKKKGPAPAIFDDTPPTFLAGAQTMSIHSGYLSSGTAPDLPAMGATNDPSPRFAWPEATDNSPFIVTYAVDGARVPDFSVVDLGIEGITETSALASGAMPDGVWYWRVRATDAAGNSSQLSGFRFTVDTQPPPPPDVDAVPADVAGNLRVDWTAGGATARYRVRLNRQSDGGGQTTVVDLQKVGTTHLFVNDGSGTSPLIDSPGTGYAVKINALDALGNQSDAVTVPFRYDTQAPCQFGSALGIQGNATFTNTTDVNLFVACGGEVPVEMAVSCDGLVQGDDDVVPYASTIPCSLSSGDGEKTAQVAVRDAAGNLTTIAEDTIVLDRTPPQTPTLEPSVILGVNNGCVAVQVQEDDDTIDANLVGWQRRVNGGPWFAGVLDGMRKVRFPFLPQDANSLVELRARDAAGNFGDPQTVVVNEVSSSVVPTHLAIHAMCGQGNNTYAILRDALSWPPVIADEGATTARAGALADFYLLDLESLELVPFSGPGGLVAGSAAAQGASAQQAKVLAAGCSRQDERLVWAFHDDADGDGDGAVRTTSWNDPLRNRTSGPAGAGPPWVLAGDATTAVGIASIDVVRWLAASGPAFEAQVTSVYDPAALPVHEVTHAIRVTTGPFTQTTFDPDFTAELAAPLSDARVIYPLARSPQAGAAGAAWLRHNGVDGWDLWAATDAQDPLTIIAAPLTTYAAADGFSLYETPFGTRAKDATYNHLTTPVVTQQAIFVDTAGDAWAFRPDQVDDPSTFVQLGSNAPSQSVFLDTDADEASWVDALQANTMRRGSDYNAPTETATFRPAVDRTRPLYTTRRIAAGAPFFVYHSDGLGAPRGVVVTYNDEAGCFND